MGISPNLQFGFRAFSEGPKNDFDGLASLRIGFLGPAKTRVVFLTPQDSTEKDPSLRKDLKYTNFSVSFFCWRKRAPSIFFVFFP